MRFMTGAVATLEFPDPLESSPLVRLTFRFHFHLSGAHHFVTASFLVYMYQRSTVHHFYYWTSGERA